VCRTRTSVSQPWSVVYQYIKFVTFKGQEEAKIRKVRLQISSRREEFHERRGNQDRIEEKRKKQ
jgi:hypothetical protein